MIATFENCELSVNLVVSSASNQLSPQYKKGLERYCKYVLRNPAGYQCKKKENKYLKQIFQLHPRWNAKAGVGFSYVTVEMSCLPPAKCFFIHRKDGSVIDISYRKCLGLSTFLIMILTCGTWDIFSVLFLGKSRLGEGDSYLYMKLFYGSMDKIVRYNWAHIDDVPGNYMLVPKMSLKIDATYQRAVLGDHKLNKIAADWNWALCGTLLVANRGGDLYVMDGQQRLMASMKRQDVDTLPCLVFPSRGVEWEAGVFWRFGTINKKLNAHELFKAKLREGNANAVELYEYIRSRGYSIGKSYGRYTDTIDFIGTLSLNFENNKVSAKKALDLCIAISDESVPLTKDIFQGMYSIVSAGIELDDIAIKKLRAAGITLITREITAQKIADNSTGGSRPSARGILKVANRRRSSKRVELPNANAADCVLA